MDSKGLETKTYYELLGVSPDAPADQIREVYKELARVYHPDSNFYDEIVPGKASNEQVQFFKILTAAYHTLTDESKRREYDEKIRPLVRMPKHVRSWDDPGDDFQVLRSTDEITERNATRARRMTGVFGRKDLLDAQEEVEEEADPLHTRPVFGTPPPASTEPPPMILLVLAGLVAGALVGGVLFYFIWFRSQ